MKQYLREFVIWHLNEHYEQDESPDEEDDAVAAARERFDGAVDVEQDNVAVTKGAVVVFDCLLEL